ncbi:concanavalin A-like lectin/glucanase domain-containing protein [Dactylonectria estremocensis]|uniref:Concanavalin A-like lectin/glucanase domain-containing protein n=1 Tax=Dactylonectria estremocensis TaxID=1079267 RepID=A0A9P9F1I4_9HYPO|nr:concanavalin A-like lectin/glucanase domain-containing protein [Dactylonectria estremocensis]
MFYRNVLTVFLSFVAIALATTPAVYPGFTKVWSNNFAGSADTLPSTSTWNIISGDTNGNAEWQRYTKTTKNVRITGKGSLQLIPRADKTAPNGWTSGRIESKYTFTPTAGKITRIQANLRLGGNAKLNKQGIWPAFWLLGQSYRTGTKWPASGEVDIMENINGQKIGYGGVHCDVAQGGRCNEPNGVVNTVSIPDAAYHNWRVDFNRKESDWKKQSITWSRDGTVYHKVLGSDIGSAAVWKTLCQSPLYIIFNVAIGGFWPGSPNSKTWGGNGSLMEIAYVAQYVST